MYCRNWANKKFKGNVKKANILKFDRLVGIELEQYIKDKETAFGKMLPKTCGIGTDQSIPNGYEVQTPPCSADKLEKMVDETVNALNAGNSSLDNQCGFHAHFDGKDFLDNHIASIRLTNTYHGIEPIIYAMQSHERRNSRFCRPIGSLISDYYLDKIDELDIKDTDIKFLHKVYYSRQIEENGIYKEEFDARKFAKGNKRAGDRIGFNLNSLYAFGNVELRYHAGTLNKDKIMDWIWLNLHIMQWVVDGYDKQTIERIRLEKSVMEKAEVLFDRTELPERLRQYIIYRLEAFSDNNRFEWIDDNEFSNEKIKEIQI